MEHIPKTAELIELGEAALVAGRTRGCLVRWIRTGKLPAHVPGIRGHYLVRLADVAALAKVLHRGRPRKVVPE